MSNTDSFIEEVTEEVRRDKLFAMFRRWGWVGGLAVILLVGGASYNEWRKARDTAAAQAFGDQILAAIEADDQGASLSQIDAATSGQRVIAGHMTAADALAGEAAERAQVALQTVIATTDAPEIYRELAAFKAALALSPDTPGVDRIAAFDALSAPGAPFRLLAQEQKALILVSAGQKDEALEVLTSLMADFEVTSGLRRRAAEMIVALGGDLDAG